MMMSCMADLSWMSSRCTYFSHWPHLCVAPFILTAGPLSTIHIQSLMHCIILKGRQRVVVQRDLQQASGLDTVKDRRADSSIPEGSNVGIGILPPNLQVLLCSFRFIVLRSEGNIACE